MRLPRLTGVITAPADFQRTNGASIIMFSRGEINERIGRCKLIR